jgi:glycerol kinase
METVDWSELTKAGVTAQQVEDTADTYFVPSFSGASRDLFYK